MPLPAGHLLHPRRPAGLGLQFSLRQPQSSPAGSCVATAWANKVTLCHVVRSICTGDTWCDGTTEARREPARPSTFSEPDYPPRDPCPAKSQHLGSSFSTCKTPCISTVSFRQFPPGFGCIQSLFNVRRPRHSDPQLSQAGRRHPPKKSCIISRSPSQTLSINRRSRLIHRPARRACRARPLHRVRGGAVGRRAGYGGEHDGLRDDGGIRADDVRAYDQRARVDLEDRCHGRGGARRRGGGRSAVGLLVGLPIGRDTP